MAPTLSRRAAPLHLDGGCSPSDPLRTWSPGSRRRRVALTYGRRPRYGPDAACEPPRKRKQQQQQQRGRGPWLQPRRGPRRAVHAPRRRWGGPWRPPPRAGCWQPRGRVHTIRLCGRHPLYLCCCTCRPGPWGPGCTAPRGRKRRWGRRGRGPRRPPRRASPDTPRVEPSSPPPHGLHDWRAPGLRAPRNTTQFIMDQVYEDLREQEELERQQGALRAQRAPAAGHDPSAGSSPGSDAQPGGEPEGAELPAFLFGRVQSGAPPNFSPVPRAPSQQLEEEEERNGECEQEECDGKDAEEQEEAEAQEEEEAEEEGEAEEEEEEAGLGEDELKEEENELPVQIPLSFLVEAEEEGEDFMNYFFGAHQIIPEVPQEAPLVDLNF